MRRVELNETHDPQLRSWVEAANAPDADFTVQNLPFSVFRRRGGSERFRGGVAIGDQIVDLAGFPGQLCELSPLAAEALALAAKSTLNELMAAGPAAWSVLRTALSRALRFDTASRNPALHAALRRALVPQAEVEYTLPCVIGDYTDFYTSIHHAISVGRLFRPDRPLLPNYPWIPLGYHGRSSSIMVSGQAFKRPRGQRLPSDATEPLVALSARLDYELELALFIGPGNEQGAPIAVERAEEHVFGLCLLNDWSARDVQAWEYQPLGPFLGKNFATTISPWIVTLEALTPYRCAWSRASNEAQPLPYLDHASVREQGLIDIELEVTLHTQAMRRDGRAPHRLSRGNYRDAVYWSPAQMIAHHTINGCNLRPGDLLATGTLSGPTDEQAGSLLELSRGGKQSLPLPGGESRTFLQDGDIVTLRAYCEGEGRARVGFGAASAQVLPGD